VLADEVRAIEQARSAKRDEETTQMQKVDYKRMLVRSHAEGKAQLASHLSLLHAPAANSMVPAGYSGFSTNLPVTAAALAFDPVRVPHSGVQLSLTPQSVDAVDFSDVSYETKEEIPLSPLRAPPSPQASFPELSMMEDVDAEQQPPSLSIDPASL
jgi:hypothetical protein